MPILIIQNPIVECLHKFFAIGDEIEFDFSDCPGYDKLEGFPESPWRARLLAVGCNDMFVKPYGFENALLVENPMLFVRLIATGPIPGSTSKHGRIVV